MKQPSFLLLTFLLTLLAACSKTPDKVISINPDELTVDDQVKIGEAFRLALESNSQSFKVLDKSQNPEAYLYIENMFGTMLNTSQVQRRREFEWSVRILHDDSIRTAFFLPGGHFYIYTGLLKFLQSESELLGVIGHELYYVDTDLLVDRIRQEFGGVMFGDILLENNVPELPKYSGSVPLLAFDSENVMAADSFAVELICPFLYEPSGVRKVLERAGLEEIKPLWLESRPGKIETRIEHLSNLATLCGLPGVANEDNYLKFKTEYLPN